MFHPENKKRIAYVVLPPGHGKSYHAARDSKLLEADVVYHPSRSFQLSAMREEAKTTNDWTQFDKRWGQLLTERLEEDSLIMVPSITIGQGEKWLYLGSAALNFDQWKQNLENRKGTTLKYRTLWESAALTGNVFTSNLDLTIWLKNAIIDYYRIYYRHLEQVERERLAENNK